MSHNSELLVHLDSGGRLSKPAHCDDELYKTLIKCWEPEKKSRPKFIELVQFFDGHYKKLARTRSRLWVRT